MFISKEMCTVKVLITLLFITNIPVIFGRMTVLKGRIQNNAFIHSSRLLLCASEDDGAALIWNNHLNWAYDSYILSDTFSRSSHTVRAYKKGKIDCDLNLHDSCTSIWDITGWSITDSIKKPMGPVFDRRWEEFAESHNLRYANRYELINNFPKTSALVISLRASADVHILVCDSSQYRSNFCYWIIIDGWSNTQTVIRKCVKGVPDPLIYPIEASCAQIRAYHLYETLSPTEWRTFILTWNETAKSISVYDEEKLIVSYQDNEEQSRNQSLQNSLFIKSPNPMVFRPHLYKFLHTSDPNVTLMSPFFHVNTTYICAEMIIGLCAECQMEIVLVDVSTESIVKNMSMIKGSTVTAKYGLPMWQYVRLNTTISSDFGRVLRIKLIPNLAEKSLNPLWAVANVRMCPPHDTVRYITMEAKQDYANYEYIWPNVTCQKLFYDEQSIISSVSDVTTNSNFADNQLCPEGMLGPYCSISCYYDLNVGGNCENAIICYSEGCTCPSGFLGPKCQTNCDIGQYGHGCKETCGSCKRNNCSFATGYCKSGCDNSKRYNIPPFCKIGIDVPLPPDIDFVNETVVHAVLPIIENYKLLQSGYQFVIQKVGKTDDRLIGDYVEIFNDSTTMTGYYNNLEPGTVYSISCILFVSDERVRIPGKWQNFTTRCNLSTKFKIDQEITSLTLKTEQKKETYSCPNTWYDFLFENCDSQLEISKGRLKQLPYKFDGLTPYTCYKITISRGTTILFSKEIRTLDEAPSRVTSVVTMEYPNGDILLKWIPPNNLNGIIQKYEVVLRVLTYIGCEDLHMQPSKNDVFRKITSDTNIIWSNLPPYTKYVAEIAAYTSQRGAGTEVVFTTRETETPTVKYRNLKFHGYTLTWEKPQDCTAISGQTSAKIIITGVSKAVRNFSITRESNEYSINLNDTLYGMETYEARVYVVRTYSKKQNEMLYEKLVFTTPPKAPPPVRDLQLYEIDWISKVAYLRWLKPESPLNGEIQYYTVTICYSTCELVTKIHPSKYCKLWNKYICATIERVSQQATIIMVSAVNVNVSTPSKALYVPITLEDIKPDAPEMLIVDVLEKGVVNLTWSHPYRTGNKILKFLINVKIISSKLRTQISQFQRSIIYEHRVKSYQSRYTEQLHLLSASNYKISIRAVTTSGIYGEGKSAIVQTSLAVTFAKELVTEVHVEDVTVSLHIPNVLNDTKNSEIYVFVKSTQSCKNHTKLVEYLPKRMSIENNENIWYAAVYPTDKVAGKIITIGDNKGTKNAMNCSLKPHQSYTIITVIQAKTGSMDDQIVDIKTTLIRFSKLSKLRTEAWLIPVTIFLVIGAVIFYYYRKRITRYLKNVSSLEDNVVFVSNTESVKVKSIFSNSKPALSTIRTPSENEFLSRTSTPLEGSTEMNINYFNQGEETTSAVKVKDFEDYIRQAMELDLLNRQYSMLPRGQSKPWEYGTLPQNKQKNRYVNLVAYDENRIVLEKLPDDLYSDYINASYIKGYEKERFYIATQGPKANTIVDFWRMIWQEEAHVICMLTNLVEKGKTKCEQYWPDIGKKKRYGDIIVFNAKDKVLADFTFRTLHVTYGDEARMIEHLHYTAWPDHGVPFSTYSIVIYLKKLLVTSPGNGPIVIHCSAGVGRTGTIILCDICLRRAAVEGVLDVFTEMQTMRSQRANTVDNSQQYLFAHLAILGCLFSLQTCLPCDEVLPSAIIKLEKQLVSQHDSLGKLTWHDKALRPSTSESSLSKSNLAKNRFVQTDSATALYRVYLKRYPASDEDSDYISAVYVDGVRVENQYIATQLPMPGTFCDFWRMIAEYKVESIIILQPPDLKDTTCCPIVPSNEFKPVPYINVRIKETVELKHYTLQTLVLVDNLEKPVTEQQVTILHFWEWKPGKHQNAPAPTSLVTLWQAAEKVSKSDTPIVVACHDGVTGCGLYLALNFLFERMAVERECDVCSAIRAIRRSRIDFVDSLEQIEYLYEAAITYLQCLGLEQILREHTLH